MIPLPKLAHHGPLTATSNIAADQQAKTSQPAIPMPPPLSTAGAPNANPTTGILLDSPRKLVISHKWFGAILQVLDVELRLAMARMGRLDIMLCVNIGLREIL